LLALLKALADDSRLRILWMLEERELCVCEIQALLGLAQSTVSRHLQILEDAGVVTATRDGLWKNYRLHPTPTAMVQSLLATVRLAAASDPQVVAVRQRAKDVCRQQLCATEAIGRDS